MNALKSLAAGFVGALLLVLTMAGAPSVAPNPASLASTAVCLLSGGAGCAMAGAVQVAASGITSSGIDLVLNAGANKVSSTGSGGMQVTGNLVIDPTVAGKFSIRNSNATQYFEAGTAGTQYVLFQSTEPRINLGEGAGLTAFGEYASALPACSVTYGGVISHRFASGIGSGICTCGRNAAGTYGWVATGVQGTFASANC